MPHGDESVLKFHCRYRVVEEGREERGVERNEGIVGDENDRDFVGANDRVAYGENADVVARRMNPRTSEA